MLKPCLDTHSGRQHADENARPCVDSLRMRRRPLAPESHEALPDRTGTLQWTVVDCPGGWQFQLHGHPNIELVLCFRGRRLALSPADGRSSAHALQRPRLIPDVRLHFG